MSARGCAKGRGLRQGGLLDQGCVRGKDGASTGAYAKKIGPRHAKGMGLCDRQSPWIERVARCVQETL